MATFISNFARVYSSRISYRLITSHHRISSLNFARNVKFIQNRPLHRCLSLSLRKTDINDETDKPVSVLTKKIAITDKNFPRELFIGRRGDNIRRLESSCGPGFSIETKHDCIVLFGTDAEGLEHASEKVKREIQRIETIAARRSDGRLREEQNPFNTFSEKVFTNENVVIHELICGRIIGKGGCNLQRLKSECGLDFRLIAHESDHIIVSGMDAEVVKKAVEKVQLEIQEMKDVIFPFSEKVLTDEDAAVHEKICRMIIGRGGSNVQQLILETGFNFQLIRRDTGHMIILGSSAQEVDLAVEKVQQEIQRIRDYFQFKEKVFTDEDADIHDRICRMIIGKEGKNIHQLQSDNELEFDLIPEMCGHLVVSGPDAKMLHKAVKIVQQEVQRIKNNLLPCSGKVFTDENVAVHNKICSILIGKAGQNLQQMIAETGFKFQVMTHLTGHVKVFGATDQDVDLAVKTVQQEVQKIKSRTDFINKIT